MFRKVKDLLDGSRKMQLTLAGWTAKVMTLLGSFLAFAMRWNQTQLATWSELVTHAQAFFDALGNWTAAAAALMVVAIAFEDGMNKLGLPWFKSESEARKDPLPDSPER